MNVVPMDVEEDEDNMPNQLGIELLKLQLTTQVIENTNVGLTWKEHSTESRCLNGRICFGHLVKADVKGLTQDEIRNYFYGEDTVTDFWSEFNVPNRTPAHRLLEKKISQLFRNSPDDIKQAYRNCANKLNKWFNVNALLEHIPAFLSTVMFTKKGLHRDWKILATQLQATTKRCSDGRQRQRELHFGNKTFMIGAQKFVSIPLYSLLTYYFVGQRRNDPRIARHIFKATRKSILLHVASYKDVKSILTIRNLCGSEKVELIEDNWNNWNVFGMCARIVAKWMRGPNRDIKQNGFVICETSNPPQWKVLLEDGEFYTCGIPKCNPRENKYNVGDRFTGPFSHYNGPYELYFVVEEYHPVRIQILMRGHFWLTTNSFKYRNRVGNTNPDNWTFLDARMGADDGRNYNVPDDDNNNNNDSSDDDSSNGLRHHSGNGMDYGSDRNSNDDPRSVPEMNIWKHLTIHNKTNLL